MRHLAHPAPPARLVVLLFALALCTTPPPLLWADCAGATGSGSGTIDDGRVTVSVSVTTPGSASSVDPAGGSRTPQLTWLVTGIGSAHTGSLEGLCDASDGTGSVVMGVQYRYIGFDRATGEVVYNHIRCVSLEADDAPAGPPAPDPPTVEEVWRTTALPAPLVGLDPPERGITGLETRIWTDAPGVVRIDASIRGYRVTGTATLVGYRVRIDDAPVQAGDEPGDAANPLARHNFETKGPHTVTVSTIWQGTNTFSGPDVVAPVTTAIGTATIAARRTYEVREVRAVLQP